MEPGAPSIRTDSRLYFSAPETGNDITRMPITLIIAKQYVSNAFWLLPHPTSSKNMGLRMAVIRKNFQSVILITPLLWLLFISDAIGNILTVETQPIPFAAQADPDTSQVDTTHVKKRKLTLAVDYSSNSSFFGRTGGTHPYPFWSPSLTYKGKRGWWLSAGSFHLLNSETAFSFNQVSLAAGWDFTFSDQVDGGISYSRYVFTSTSPLVQSASPHYLSAFIGYDWSYVYSTLNASYITGQGNDLFISFENSWYMEIAAGKKSTLSFEPKISIIAGTQNFASTIVETRSKGRKPNGKGAVAVATNTGSGFGIIDYEFRLPVTYTVGSLGLELAWRYVMPVNLASGDLSTHQSIFSAGVYYTFQ